jgi:hypothetical protein
MLPGNMPRFVLAPMSLILLVGCGGKAAPPATEARAEKAPPATTATALAPPTGGWSCLGAPPDVAAGWKTEIAAVPATKPNALEEAMAAAQDKLRKKVCTNADRDPTVADACGFLVAHIEPWKTGSGDRETCAAVVLKREYIDEWTRLASDLGTFDKALASSAKSFVDAIKGRQARISISAIYDDDRSDPKQNQLPGGRRADWLASRFKTNFASMGGVVTQPKGWIEPQPAPSGFDLVVVGHMFKRGGTALPRVEVSWTAYTADGRQIESSSGTFPEAAAPPPPQSTPPPIPVTPGLFLSMDSDHQGSICSGENTQLWLKSSEALHVRVFDLYGTDGAVLIYPQAGQNDLVPAGRTIPLAGEKGFEAVPFPGTENERYVVIAAPQVSGLGAFAAANETCRLSPADGAALHRGEGVPAGAKVAVTGYRIISGDRCPQPPSPQHVNALLDSLKRFPVCKR